MILTKRYLTTAILISLVACRSHKPVPPELYTLVPSTGINFSNNVANTPEFNIINYRNFYNGGGVAIGDINNDGLADVFFTSNIGPNKLYLNKGNWKFEDISASAGFAPSKQQWSTGVVMADINGDGWLDIYVCNAGHMENGSLRKNQLFINNHNNTFTDSAEQYGLADSGYTTQASFFDYDRDGDLDCFLINNSPLVNTLDYVNQRSIGTIDTTGNALSHAGGDHLYRNDNGHFVEVTGQAGIHGKAVSLGLGVTVGDINNDGYPDIYVSNDFFERDYLYINQKNGTFKDELEDRMQHTSLASMGADLADINNDGIPDIFTTDMLPADDYRLKTTFAFESEDVYRIKQRSGFYHQFFQNTLQLNDRQGKFRDIAWYSGVSATDWSWGGLLFDMDNDGYNDIYVCNGIAQDLINQDFLDFFANNLAHEMQTTGKKIDISRILEKIPSQLVVNKVFRNLGNLRFSDIGNSWGFTQPSFSNGAAYGDLDNDGDLDLIVNNVNQPAFIYRNNSRQMNHNNFIGFSLKGRKGNNFAIGSRIFAYSRGTCYYREIMPARGFQSSVDYKQIIGLGANTTIDSAIIEWPDGSRTRLLAPAIRINQVNDLSQPTATTATDTPPAPKPSPILKPIPSNFEKHAEDDYIDFYTEHNLPKMLSREGPKAAAGDINGDGLEDVCIGGTQGHPTQCYLQTPAGTFVKKDQPAFAPFSDFEDDALLLFDADNDGDLDLFIGPGGNNAPPYSRQLQFRLFVNDGKGNFTLNANAFPANANNSCTAVAAAYDFNRDGYPDLFIGGRNVPHNYGSPPASHLFINDGKGNFTVYKGPGAAALDTLGMVTGAVWADITGDSAKELIVTGEWMYPHIFSVHADRVEELNTNLTGLFGWWQSVTATDLDGDGKQDLVLGNIGENFYLRPSPDQPVRLWINDFDNNGIKDKILTRSINNRDMPVFLKKEMETQLPSLKKQNLNYAKFAGKSIQDLFSAEALDSCRVLTFNYPRSIIAFNKGNGKFDLTPLPPMVQLSSVNAIRSIDLNGDGSKDLVLCGNEFGFLPQFGRLDASCGNLLLNNGHGKFDWLEPGRSGLELTGQVRDITPIKGRDQLFLLFLRNDEYPVLYNVLANKK